MSPPSLSAINTKMLTKVGAILILLLSAQFADAQILRRLFHRPTQSGGCANGQCEVAPQFAPAPTVQTQSSSAKATVLAAFPKAVALRYDVTQWVISNGNPGYGMCQAQNSEREAWEAALLLVRSAKACPCPTCPDCKECCKDGACEVPGASSPWSQIRWVSHGELHGILDKLDQKPHWKATVKAVRSQVAGWKGEPSVAVNEGTFIAWQKEIGVTETESVRSLDGKTFAGSLSKQLASKGKLTLQERHLQRILNGPDTPRRDRQLARMESHVRVELNLSPTAVVDWSAIDWPTMIQRVLQLLIMLLPLFV